MTKRLTELEILLEYGIDPASKTIVLSGDVCQELSSTLTRGLIYFASAENVTIILDSFGGDVYAGFGMYDAIKSFPGHVTVVARGSVMSMASVILQAADSRVMEPDATMMLHVGEDSYTGHAHSFQKVGIESKRMEERMFAALYERTQGKISEKGLRKLLAHDSFLSANDAIAHGLADGVEGTE